MYPNGQQKRPCFIVKFVTIDMRWQLRANQVKEDAHIVETIDCVLMRHVNTVSIVHLLAKKAANFGITKTIH